MKHAMKWVICAIILAMAVPGTAFGLSKADKKAIKKAASEGTRLYLRVDAPCATGRHPYGTYKRPLVEASPTGINTDADTVFNASWWHADSTYWGVRVNDPVEVDDLDIEVDDRTVEIELEGVDQADGEDTVVMLVEIDSLEDFQAAFDSVFAHQPLQDEHDDWSGEVKEQVANRQLAEGMNKRQVYYITGRPEEVTKTKEDGSDVEIWKLRRNRGVKVGFWGARSAGEEKDVPETLRFVDGKLADIGASSSAFSLDD